jgi:hypothetical protein
MTTLWRAGRDDLRALLLIALLPLLIAAPLLFGVLNADPALYVAGISVDAHGAAAPDRLGPGKASPVVDANNGVTTQALGYRAAFELMHGQMPWWNAYSGVGLPLAAEYQPAAFFPPTLLLLLPQGMLLEHLLLQMLAGWGTYALLRQLGLSRLGSLTGGLLYAFNGTLALWGSANILPLPFLPWMLFGVERAQIKAVLGLRGGWRLFGGAVALGLLGGFPEEAYINGLFALAWAGLRLLQLPADKRLAFAWRITLGGLVGVGLAAPQIFAFLESLASSFLWMHAGHVLANAKTASADIVPSLMAPYVFGPIDRYSDHWPEIRSFWGGMGGYVTAAILVVAGYGLTARRSLLGGLLLAWILLAVGRMFGIQPAVFLWNLVPGAGDMAVPKYIQPSWSLALVILAAFGLDDMAVRGSRRGPLLAAGLTVLGVIGGSLIFLACFWPKAQGVPGLSHWMAGSLIWAVLAALACLGLLARPPPRWSGPLLAALLTAESAVMFAIPALGDTPRGQRLDMAAVDFLRSHLGLQRVYSLGPLGPNYGAYFGVAAINNSYVPGSLLWDNWVGAHLDSGANPFFFAGQLFRNPNKPGAAEALRTHLQAFEQVGVKYVLANSGDFPLDDGAAPVGGDDRLYLALTPGQSISGVLPTKLADVAAISVSLDTRGGAARGVLKVNACSGGRCVSGVAPVQGGDVAEAPLTAPLPIQGGQMRYSFSYDGDAQGIGLWAYPNPAGAASQMLLRASGPVVGRGLKLRLSGESTVKLAYADAVMSVFELPHPATYFEALPNQCAVSEHGRAEAVADCQGPSTLLRRELFYPGWTARVNGADATITKYGDLFQAVQLPPGHSVVRYRYAPPHIIWMWTVFWAALASLAASGGRQYLARREFQPGTALAISTPDAKERADGSPI